MLWIWIAAMFGIFRYRGRAYWRWVVILAAWLFAIQSLFYAGGDLQHPEGDGLITRQIRAATEDGIGMGLFAIIFVVAYWGGIIFIVRKLWQNGKVAQEQELQREADEIGRDLLGRKLGEAAIATLIAAAWIYVTMIAPRMAAQGVTPVITPPAALAAPTVLHDAPDPIAGEIAESAAEINRQGIRQLDPITKLASASAEGRVLTYHYELSRRDGSDDELRAFARKKAVTAACKNGDMLRMMKDYEVTFRYSYMFPKASAPVAIDATYRECQSLGLAP